VQAGDGSGLTDGHGVVSVSVKLKLALKTALIFALFASLPGSAVPRTVPLNTRPWENMTNVPVAIPEVETPTEKTPNEFAAQSGVDVEQPLKSRVPTGRFMTPA
jgi:hypothetical protein